MGKDNTVGKRQPVFIVVVGRRGVGKTRYTLTKTAIPYVKGNPQANIPGRRVLIFDVNNEREYKAIKPIALKELTKWCREGRIEIRKISAYKAIGDETLTTNGKAIYESPNGVMTLNEMARVLGYLGETYKDGMLIVEDPTKYISASIPADVIGRLCTIRQAGVDVIFHFQTIARYQTPQILGNANYVRMHKTFDSASARKVFSDYGYMEALIILENIVDIRYSKRTSRTDWANITYCAWFDVDDVKCKGNFSLSDFQLASYKYIREHELVEKFIKKKHAVTGQPIYKDRTQVIRGLVNEFTEKYYGN